MSEQPTTTWTAPTMTDGSALTADRAAATKASSQSTLRTALAGLLGNVLEWFDFAVYGYFASDIGRHFFSQSSPTAQQLLAFAVFALGVRAPPLGSPAVRAVGGR